MAVLEPIGMEPNEKLVWARIRAGFKSASEAARAHKWNENTYRSHENGERGIRLRSAEIYGEAYGVRSSFFLTRSDDINTTSKIPVVGKIGEKGLIDRSYYMLQGHYYFQAVVPFISHDHVVSYEVDENINLIAVRPGDLILTWRSNAFLTRNAEKINGMLCIVMEDGKHSRLRYVRETNEAGVVNLDLPSIIPEDGACPDFIAPVHVIVPAKQWRKEAAEGPPPPG